MKQGLFPPNTKNTNNNNTSLNLPILSSPTDDVDISMDDSHASAMSVLTSESHNTNTSTSMLSLPSPPRTQRRKQQRNTNMAVRSLTMNTHHHHSNNNSTNKSNSTIHNNNNNNNNNNTVRNRLFVDDDEDDDDPTKHDNNKNNNHHISRHHGGCGKTPSILNPIDLNLDFAELGPSTTTVLAASASAAYDDEDDNGSTPPRLSRRTSTLTPHPPSRPFTARTKKRSAEQHDLYGKEWNCTTNNNHNHNDDDVFSAMESPVDMYTSPRVSSPSSPSHNSRTTTGPGGGGGGGGGNSHTPCNSNYSNKSSGRMSIHRGSPFLYGGGGGNAAAGGGGQRTHNTPNNMLQSHKSPSSFQTLDGRTVQSKNPFSPMIFDVSLTPTQKHQLYLSSRNNSPAIPPMFANNDLSFPLGCGDDNDNNNGDDGDGGNNNNNNGSSSFGSGGTTGKGGGGPRRGSHLVLRHKLQKRPSSPANSNGVGVGVTGHIGIQHQHHLHQPIAAASAASVSANNNNMGIGIGMDGLMPPPLPSKDIIINKNIKVNNSNINNNINNSTSRDPLEQRASLYVRDGYPEKKGRYSFTGSPIKEQLEPTSAAASSSSSSSTYIAAAAAAQTNFTATGPSSALSTTSSINTEMMSIKSKPSYQMNEEDEDVKEVVNTSICTEDDVTVTSTTQEDFCTNIHKIRRRRKDDDVVAAGAQGESSWKRNGMYIQTNSNSNSNNNDYYDNTNNANSNDDNNNDNDDEWGYYNNNNNRNNNNSKTYYYNKQRSDHPDDNISPTDVLNFPLFRASPSNTSDVPPAPSKPIRRPPSRRYTPIRKPTGPPPTPLPSVRNSRSFEEEDTAFLGRRNGNDNGDEDSSDDDDNGDDRISNVAQRRCRRLRPKSGGMDYLNLSPGVGGAGGEQTVGPPSSRFYSDFDVIAELGSGSFGNVYQALSRLDGCMYAIKVAHRAARGESDKDRMLKEVYALAALSDQADTATFHIVRYHQAWMEEQRLYIQTELCTTTLQAEIEQVAPMQLPLSTRYKCMREILLALEFIHRNGMVHLDIKPENIFVSS